MTSDRAVIDQWLDEWEIQNAAGHTVDIAELCQSRPDLESQFRERLDAFLQMDRLLRRQEHREHLAVTCEADRGDAVTAGMVSVTGSYEIVREHARGGLGEVYVARDCTLGRTVALKKIRGDRPVDDPHRRRFLREAEITARLDHPGIVPVLNLATDADGNPCYSMKFVDGESLSETASRLHREFQQKVAQGTAGSNWFTMNLLRPLVSRLITVCNTIAYAHSRGIIHRDIKPANIMLGAFGATYVVDWGLALYAAETSPSLTDRSEVPQYPAGECSCVLPAAVHGESADTGALTSWDTADDDQLWNETLTKTGTVVGTPAYMSPEQTLTDGTRATVLSDVYGLGATLYFVLAGRPPIEGQGDVKWLQQLRCGAIPNARSHQRAIPVALDCICRKAMSVAPEQRYPSPLELARDLENWLSDQPIVALPDSVTVRISRSLRKHRAWAQAGAAAMLLITLLSIGFAVELNSRRLRAETAEKTSVDLAADKTRLAESEAEQRKLADDQAKASLETLKKVTSRVARQLKTVDSGTREQILTVVYDGLAHITRTLETQDEIARERGIAHQEMGRVYLTAGSSSKVDATAEALRQFQQARDVFLQLTLKAPKEHVYQQDLSIAYESIGNVQLQLGHLNDAEAAYAESLRISEAELEKQPEDVSRLRDVAFGCEKCGDVRRNRGQWSEARKFYEQYLSVVRRMIQMAPSKPLYQRDLIVGRSKLGNVQRQEGLLNEAAQTYQECVAGCLALEQIPDSGIEKRDRAVNLNKLGLVLSEQKKFTEAASAFDTALQISKELLMQQPTNTLVRRDVALALLYSGSCRKELEDAERARGLYAESLSIRRELVVADGSSVSAKVELAIVLTEIGELEIGAGNPESARPMLEEGVAILKSLSDAGKLDDADGRKTLEAATGFLTQLSTGQL